MKQDSFNADLSQVADKPIVDLPNPAPASLTPPDLAQDTVSEEDAWAYDEPACQWRPLGRDDQDCGDGVICPPCD